MTPKEIIEEFREKFGDSAPYIAMRSFNDCDKIEKWLFDTLEARDKELVEALNNILTTPPEKQSDEYDKGCKDTMERVLALLGKVSSSYEYLGKCVGCRL